MDFLDPKRKKAHRQRLLVGYILVAIAVAMGTLILLFSAFGFDVDRKTGDVIQNGTVFLDSQPGGSSVYLNGVLQGNKTATRLVLPGSRQYTVKLTQNGYRDWSRTFALDGGRIERLVYPILVPNNLKTTENQLYATAPLVNSQSPDRRWLLVQQPGQTYSFDLYDLNSPTNSPAVVTIPQNILTEPAAAATVTAVEWSNDNKRILIERDFNNTHEFLMFDTTNVANSVNINAVLSVSPTSISLRDKKYDQLYIYDSVGGILRIGDLKARTVSKAILSNVLDYKSYSTDTILFATHQGAEAGKVDFRIREDDKATYLLKTSTDDTKFLLDVSNFDQTPFYVVGTSADDSVFVYRDPLPTLKGQSRSPLLITTIMRIKDPQFVSFSASSQFISVQSASKFSVYDVDADRQYNISLSQNVANDYKIKWMDAYRFSFVDKNKSYMIDFDGSNIQPLVPSLSNGLFFSQNYETVFNIAPSAKVNGRYALTQTSLIKK